jgi:hypothetical protein
VDLNALRRRISETLDAVRDRDREALARRLERARRRERAAGVSAERAALEADAEKRFQAELDARGAEMANLAVQIASTAALQRSYTVRGAAWTALAEEMGNRNTALQESLTAARGRRSTEVYAVFDWLEEQFRLKAVAEDEAAKEWQAQHQREVDILDQSIEKEKELLLNALEEVTLSPPVKSGDGIAPPLSLALSTPPLPSPRLGARIAALKARRGKLAAFILQNTKAIVKAAAAQQIPPEQPVFEPTTAGYPNRTDTFRSAVQDAPAVLERLS